MLKLSSRSTSLRLPSPNCSVRSARQLLRRKQPSPTYSPPKPAGRARRRQWRKKSLSSIAGTHNLHPTAWLIPDRIFSAHALQQQNSLLHSQLEDVNHQAAQIRQTASAAAESFTLDSSETDADAKMQQLREVIAFVRKEKEIVDLQLHLAQVDNTRIKSEVERLNASLDETRTTLLKVSLNCALEASF